MVWVDFEEVFRFLKCIMLDDQLLVSILINTCTLSFWQAVTKFAVAEKVLCIFLAILPFF